MNIKKYINGWKLKIILAALAAALLVGAAGCSESTGSSTAAAGSSNASYDELNSIIDDIFSKESMAKDWVTAGDGIASALESYEASVIEGVVGDENFDPAGVWKAADSDAVLTVSGGLDGLYNCEVTMTLDAKKISWKFTGIWDYDMGMLYFPNGARTETAEGQSEGIQTDSGVKGSLSYVQGKLLWQTEGDNALKIYFAR